MFACTNYQPGDRIFAFGFSRGAFTIRVLMGLIDDQGLITGAKGQRARTPGEVGLPRLPPEVQSDRRAGEAAARLRDWVLRRLERGRPYTPRRNAEVRTWPSSASGTPSTPSACRSTR